jgi:Transposase DNA-binding/Transposase DDE domain
LIVLSIHEQEPMEWARRHFGEIDLGDLRRDQRAMTIATAMAANPGKSIPQLFAHPYDVKASYQFFRREETTPDDLQAGHREFVLEEMEKPGRYLLLEDSSEMTWPGTQPIPGLGPIGAGAEGLQGFHLHSTLAVRWRMEACEAEQWPGRAAVEVLGLADQQYQVRKPRPEGEKKRDSKVRKLRARESEWWEETGERIGQCPECEDLAWIRVCDRGADIYEMLRGCQALNHRFVIRASQDRALSDEEGRANLGRLFATARAQQAWGEFKLELRARPAQAARTAEMKLSAVEVWLRSPQRPGKNPGYLPPIRCRVVRVWEENAPKGVEALEWILLTDCKVENFAQALEVALIYSTRWLIEEFHKALKSGTKAEDLQLETAEGLFAAIAIKSVVALRLLDLRERLRIMPEAPAAESGLSELKLEVLRTVVNRPVKTVKEVALAIGRLGGHLNRKGDGLPGWLTLFRGMSKLNDLVEGALIGLKMKRSG